MLKEREAAPVTRLARWLHTLQMNIIERSFNTLKFVLKDTMPAFANSLRRTMLAHVPTMAIEDVIIVENNSSMFDEFLAHRLGLIPLKADISQFEFRESCECGGRGCNLCQVNLTLQVETKDEKRMVYSSDLVSIDGRVEPVSGEIPIVKLGPDQKISLEAVAVLGVGAIHAKWQPVSTVGMQYMPIIELDMEKITDETRKAAQKCYRNVFHVQRGGFEIANPLDCTLCMECVNSDPTGAIKVHGDPSQIIFTVESTGALSPEQILDEAALILKERAEMFQEELDLLEVNSETKVKQ